MEIFDQIALNQFFWLQLDEAEVAVNKFSENS